MREYYKIDVWVKKFGGVVCFWSGGCGWLVGEVLVEMIGFFNVSYLVLWWLMFVDGFGIFFRGVELLCSESYSL